MDSSMQLNQNSAICDMGRESPYDFHNTDSSESEQSQSDESVTPNLLLVPGKSLRFFKLQKCSTTTELSPITEISMGLEDTNLNVIGTPTTGKVKISDKINWKKSFTDSFQINDDTEEDDCIDDDNCIIIDDDEVTDSLLSNNFTINSAGRSPSSRLAEQRSRGVQRRQNIAPIRISYENDKIIAIENGSGLSTSEELSFYSGNSPQNSPRPCSVSPCMDMGLLSPETSPNKFSTISIPHDNNNDTRRTAERQQLQLQQPQRRLMVLDEHDINSMDSGYGSNNGNGSNKSSSVFRFPFPVQTGMTTVTALTTTQGKRKTPSKLMTMTTTNNGGSVEKMKFKVYNSLSSSSMESMDDEEFLYEMDAMDEDAQLPTDLSSLISGDIKTMRRTTPEAKSGPLARRCLSLNDSPLSNRARNNLNFEHRTPDRLKVADENAQSVTPYSARIGDSGKCFKRPEPPAMSPIQSKRYKFESTSPRANQENVANIIPMVSPVSSTVTTAVPAKRPIFKKSISMNDAHIMSALARSTTEPDLIGDFSKPFCLPLIDGRHRDLKSISCDTLAALINGEFESQVGSFQIVDCRYPYEFEGGHIRSAKNLYTQEDIMDVLVNNKTETPTPATTATESMDTSNMFTAKRNILIFHCEFSSERGPKLSRFLRNNDRMRNEHIYPTLVYPEIYLLHGGYKEFYETHSTLCDPVGYRPMLHASFSDAYRQFRAKSKSWNGDSAKPNRLVKSRSRLVL